MQFEDVLRSGWERFQGNDDRRTFAKNKVWPVYTFVSDDKIIEAKNEWAAITIEARARFIGLLLDDPDPTLLGHSSIQAIERVLADVMNNLYRNTNNEALQKLWRSATRTLFDATSAAVKNRVES